MLGAKEKAFAIKLDGEFCLEEEMKEIIFLFFKFYLDYKAFGTNHANSVRSIIT
jgi:hypothetical protein